MTIHKTQAAVVIAAILAVLAQPDILALVPPKYLVWVLAVTNVLSAVLPKVVDTPKPKE